MSSLVQQTDNSLDIHWQIIQILMLMQNTTSILVSNTLFLLSRNATVWASLRKDITGSETEKSLKEKLKNIQTLQNVMRECKTDGPVTVRMSSL